MSSKCTSSRSPSSVQVSRAASIGAKALTPPEPSTSPPTSGSSHPQGGAGSQPAGSRLWTRVPLFTKSVALPNPSIHTLRQTLHLRLQHRQRRFQTLERLLHLLQFPTPSKHLQLQRRILRRCRPKITHRSFQTMSTPLQSLCVPGSYGGAYGIQLRGTFLKKKLGHLLQQLAVAAHPLQRYRSIQHGNLIGKTHGVPILPQSA